ncbi:hypothetical protein CL655_03960 [bacterium]|nr:hypothetical protein [bacterium]|tara:strand:- start:599 stop:784 length:186 start_codon:yes stop_codon:yes gene_type:complete
MEQNMLKHLLLQFWQYSGRVDVPRRALYTTTVIGLVGQPITNAFVGFVAMLAILVDIFDFT